MKHMLTVVLAAGLLALAAPNAFALFSVSADVPVSYSYSESDLGGESVSGFKLGVNLPFFMGLGFENYSVDADISGGGSFTHDVRMYDLYLDLPFPVLNLSIGGGVGSGKITVDSGPVTLDDSSLTQLFAEVGIPFAGIFDVHAGYHKISGDADVLVGGTKVDTANLDAAMWTLGMRIGF